MLAMVYGEETVASAKATDKVSASGELSFGAVYTNDGLVSLPEKLALALKRVDLALLWGSQVHQMFYWVNGCHASRP